MFETRPGHSERTPGDANLCCCVSLVRPCQGGGGNGIFERTVQRAETPCAINRKPQLPLDKYGQSCKVAL